METPEFVGSRATRASEVGLCGSFGTKPVWTPVLEPKKVRVQGLSRLSGITVEQWDLFVRIRMDDGTVVPVHKDHLVVEKKPRSLGATNPPAKLDKKLINSNELANEYLNL